MKKIMLIVLAMVFMATYVFAKDYVKVSDIQKVSLTDTFEQVTEKIGEPQQVLSKELTADGKEQAVWLYETVGKPSDFGLIPGGVRQANLRDYQQQRANNPPYLVIFTNGKVSKIERQKVETIPTARIDVKP